jgi:hypothetical protein
MPELAQSAGFILYPRGFFGAELKPSIKKHINPFSSEVKRLQPSVSLFHNNRSGDPVKVNEDVEALYAQLISREETIDDFVFREAILNCALSAFGTQQFDFWYSQQQYIPSAGNLHREFLEDILQFISTGTRCMHLQTWNDLINSNDTGHRQTVLSEKAMAFFGVSSNGLRRESRNSRLVDVLIAWTSQPGGFMDLLFTLHILFGVR